MIISYIQDNDNQLAKLAKLAKLFRLCLILVEFSTQSGLSELFEGPLPPIG